jgi:predicted O-linked N-acetylglucosamine transferase (SPINDLY family)
MGVPVVSLAGRSNVSRSGAGLLAEVGLADLVCDSPDRYVSCAVRLARDPRRLEKLRSDLRGRMAGSALCDEAGYAGAVESALRLAWGRWCERAPSWE